jgi:hypothetical protein
MSDRTRFDDLADAASRYGALALDNYAQIRSVAENVAIGFCRHLGGPGKCVFLVPPEGAWAPQPYQSGAFSVSGTGFLPLGPISFGLAVKVSRSGDWLRLVLTCSKNGPAMDIGIEGGRHFSLGLPIGEADLTELFVQLEDHLVDWFKEQSDHYEHGAYGSREIGFEFVHADPDDEASSA